MPDLSAPDRAQSLRHLAASIGQTASLADMLGLDGAAIGLRHVLAQVPVGSEGSTRSRS